MNAFVLRGLAVLHCALESMSIAGQLVNFCAQETN